MNSVMDRRSSIAIAQAKYFMFIFRESNGAIRYNDHRIGRIDTTIIVNLTFHLPCGCYYNRYYNIRNTVSKHNGVCQPIIFQ